MTGWCPFAIKRPLSFSNFFANRLGFIVKAVCLHIADGPMVGVFPTFNHLNSASAHFCVGKDGAIEQYVSIADAAWANGLSWQNGQWFTGDNRLVNNPSWSGLEAGVNPNLTTISIEHDGHPDELWTAAMYDANNRLLQWIATETGLIYVAHRTLIGHFEIDPLERPNCPGPHVDYGRIATDANSALVPTAISAALLAAIQSDHLLPINPDTALYKFAQKTALGYPQTDEFKFTSGSASFVGQVYAYGIVYVPAKDFNDVRFVRKVEAADPQPGDSLERQVITAAEQSRPWLPINPAAALYHFAQAQGLGFPRSDEFRFAVAAANYIGQDYQFGSVCVRDGDWGNIKVVRSPGAGAPPPGAAPDPNAGHIDPGVPAGTQPPPPIDTRGFVGVRAEDFVIAGKPFRFVGMNIRGLVHYGDKQFLPSSEELDRIVQLDAARAMGARVIRVFLGNKLRSVAETAARLETTLALADERDLYVIVAFTNIFNTVGFFPRADEHFYTGEGDKLSIDFYRAGYTTNYLPFVEQIVEQFRSQKRIFAWELGNELKADPFVTNVPPDAELFIQFASKVSKRIHELDHAHLVTTGCISTRQIGCNWDQSQRLYGMTTLDFVTCHNYLGNSPQEDDLNVAHALGKPCIIEESGAPGNSSRDDNQTQDRVPRLQQYVQSSFDRGLRGVMLWGLMATPHDMGDGDDRFGIDRSLHTDYDQVTVLLKKFAGQVA